MWSFFNAGCPDGGKSKELHGLYLSGEITIKFRNYGSLEAVAEVAKNILAKAEDAGPPPLDAKIEYFILGGDHGTLRVDTSYRATIEPEDG